jgi:putative PEP-CTERM system TPR-repeat lipoprotein
MGRVRHFSLVALVLLALGGCSGTTADEHLANGRDRLAAGEVRTAVIELRNALQKQPDLAEARLLLGEANARLGDFAGALKEFERSLDLGIDDDRVRIGLLDAKVRLGRYQEVIGELADRADAAASPGDAELPARYLVILGDAYLAAGDAGRAAAAYARAPEEAGAQLGLGTLAWQDGDLNRAERHLERATSIDPDLAEAWLRLGDFELSRQNLDRAASAFQRAMPLPLGVLESRVGLTRVHLVQGDLDGAAERVAELLERAPQLPVAHYLDAMIKFERDDVDGAEAAVREVQRHVPDHGPSFYLMGVIKYRQGQLAQAEDNLRRFLARDPANVSAAKVLAAVLFDQDKFGPVVDLLQPFRHAEADAQLLAMYGAAQLQLGRPGPAADALAAAVTLAPDMATFRNQLAISLLAAGDRSGAEAQLRSAIDVDGSQFQSDYLVALLRLRDRDWDAASDSVESLISKSPDSPIGYNLRGAIALARNDGDGARRAFEDALARDPGFLPAAQNLARMHVQEGNPAAAIAQYQSLLEQQPDNHGALMALAELMLRGGDRDAAIGYLERAVSSDPEAVRARLALARLRLEEGNRAEAARHVDEALARAPEQPDLLLLRAELALQDRNVDDARDVARKLQSLLAARPENGALHVAVGVLQSWIGMDEPARINLERSLTLSGGNQAHALRSLVRLDLRQRDVVTARQRFDGLTSAGDNEVETRLLETDVLLAEGRRDEAQALLETLAEADVRNAVIRLATMELADGDGTAAGARLERWLARRPDDVGAQVLLADAVLRRDADQAVARYEDLVDTGNPVVLNNLAWLYMERDDPRALELARRAAEAAPDNPDILDTLGWILFREGRVDEAVTHLRRSVELNPANPIVHHHLGTALARMGDRTGARRALAIAAAADGYADAHRAARELEALGGD